MAGPAFAKLPSVGHTLSDLAELHTGGAEHATHTVAHNVRQHRTERLVVRSDLVDQSAQCLDRRLGSAIHGSHTQFGTDVHKQLITARRHTIGQRIGGIAFADLIGANLSRVSQQCGNRIGCLEWNIRDGSARRSTGGSCSNRNFRNSSRSRGNSRSSSRRRGRSRNCRIVSIFFRNQRIGIGHVYAAFIATNVVHRHIATGKLRQTQRLGTQIGERRSIAETNLNILVHTKTALLGGTEQQSLRLNPTHRRGELPRQQFRKQQSAELLIISSIGIPNLRII